MKADEVMTGGCLCGDIRYSVSGRPVFVSQCCCKDCQKATGTGHTTIAGIHRDQLSLDGVPATYTTSGDTGGDVVRHFCARCAGRLYTSGTLPGDIVMIQAGSLDEPNRVRPESVIYAKDRLAWDWFDPALPQFPMLPPRDF